MPTLHAEQLPIVAAALMRLRGDTLNSVGTPTGIRAANLSVWLRGKEQVISAKRVAGLLYYLGVEGGRLRSDVLHRWHDAGPLDDVKTVLGTLIANGTITWLFQDTQPGLTKTRYLRVGDAWIRVELTPGAADAKELADMLNAQRVLTLPAPLAAIPTESLHTACDALLTMAEQTAVDVGDEEMLEGLMFRLGELASPALTMSTASSSGWIRLERTLQSALKHGINPGDIARLIDDTYGNGNSSAPGGR